MRYRYGIITFFFLLTGFSLRAQDITGLWKGTLHNDTTGRNLRYEIAISENKGKLSGFSHTFFILDDKEYFGVKRVKVRREDDKIIIQEVELLSNNYPIPPAKGVHQLDVLTLEVKDNVMVLTGPFTTNRTREYHPLTGSVYVERKTNYRQSALVPHLEELGLSKDLSFIKAETPEETIAAIAEVATPIVEQEEVNAVADNNQGQLITKTNKPLEVNLKVDTAKAAVASVPPPVTKQPAAVVASANPTPKQTVTSNPVVKQPAAAPATKQPASTVASTPVTKPVTSSPVAVTPAATPVTTQPVAVTKPPVTATTNLAGSSVAVDLNNRKIETIQSVYYKSDSLVLTLYDNGEIDGDTVSVLMNGEILIAKAGLSTHAIRKTIYITQDMPDSIQLIMYAENLGSIPPNTGLLVVRDGASIYEIRFSGDYKKNAAIIFRRKK